MYFISQMYKLVYAVWGIDAVNIVDIFKTFILFVIIPFFAASVDKFVNCIFKTTVPEVITKVTIGFLRVLYCGH